MFFVSLGKRAVGRPNQPTFLSLPQTSSLNRQIGSSIDIDGQWDGSPVRFFISSLVSFHFLWVILCQQAVQYSEY